MLNSKNIDLNINGKIISILVVYKTYVKPRMILKIKDEQVTVFCSPIFTDENITNFVTNSSFAKNNFQIFEKQKWLNIESNYFWFLGQKYLYSLIKVKKEWFLVSNNLVLFIGSMRNKYDSIQKAIITYFKKYIEERTFFWTEKMKIPNYKVTIRPKSSAWATNYKKEKIHYSSYLIPFGKDIVDYVIIHELSHHYYWGHNRLFWSIVKQFCPNYKEIQNKLNNYEYF